MIKNCQKTAASLPELSEAEALPAGVCPVDWARRTAETARQDSCGQGTFCRDGLAQIFTIIDDIAAGRSKADDLNLLTQLCQDIITVEDCVLSSACARLVLTSLERYRGEWEAHADRRRCAALVCRGCYTVHIDPAKCTGCGSCLAVCPEHCIDGGRDMIHVVDSAACSRCGRCFDCCPAGAFLKAGAVKPKTPDAPVPVGSFAAGTARRRHRNRQ